MKKDLLTVAVAAIIGFVIAYFLTNLVYPGLDSFSFKVLEGDASYGITEPDPEIFNFRSVNPTVEVYVGQCKEYNDIGECIGSVTETDLSDAFISEEDLEDNTDDNSSVDDSMEETNNGDVD